MRCKAAVLREINKPLEIQEIDIPTLHRGQVLVKIYYSGICASQLNEIRGRKGKDRYLPHLLGHEGSGVIEAIGEDVTKVNIGDHVVCSWIKGHGLEGGPKKYGEYNAGSITTFQDFSIISENRLVKIPKDLPLDKAALFGCMIPTGAGSVLNLVNIKKKDIVIIFGAAGNIGSAALIALKQIRPRKIIAVDKDYNRLQYAQELGCSHISRTDTERQKNVIRRVSHADYAIETTGNPELIEIACECIKDTGKVILIGNPPKGSKISIYPMDIINGKIIGSWGGFTDKDNTYPDKLIRDLIGILDIDKIRIIKYKLDDINQAIEDFENGVCGKIVIEL